MTEHRFQYPNVQEIRTNPASPRVVATVQPVSQRDLVRVSLLARPDGDRR